MRTSKLLAYSPPVFAETLPEMLDELAENRHAILVDSDREFVLAAHVTMHEGRQMSPEVWARIQQIYQTYQTEMLL